MRKETPPSYFHPSVRSKQDDRPFFISVFFSSPTYYSTSSQIGNIATLNKKFFLYAQTTVRPEKQMIFFINNFSVWWTETIIVYAFTFFPFSFFFGIGFGILLQKRQNLNNKSHTHTYIVLLCCASYSFAIHRYFLSFSPSISSSSFLIK